MEQQKNVVDLAALKQQCLDCGESNLAFYCDALRKVQRAFHKMEETEMLSYASQIIKPAFPNIVIYFEDRVRACIEAEKEIEKAHIREDVENSIVEFCEMFDTIIHSTNTVDQILFQTAPLHTGIRYTAPKLCAYYSQVLNSFAKLLQDNQLANQPDKQPEGQPDDQYDKYAFCVYPTLNSKAQAGILFETMERRGKVCVIRVPGHQIAAVDKMLLLLFHELFHILPGEEQRKRKERAGVYWQVLLYAMKEKLYSGFDLTLEEENHLAEHFFSPMTVILSEFFADTLPEDRNLYSRHLQEWTLSEFLKVLQKILESGIQDYRDILYKGKTWDDFQAYNQSTKRVKRIYGNMRKNAQILVANNRFVDEAEFYMKLFREPFADMLTILLLRLSPGQYFEGICGQGKGDLWNRGLLSCRVFFVVKTLMEEYAESSDEQKKLLEQWKNWKKTSPEEWFLEYFIQMEKMLENLKVQSQGAGKTIKAAGGERTDEEKSAEEKPDEEGADEDAENIQVVMNGNICEKYLDYFKKCCGEFIKLEREKNEEFQGLRDKYGLQLDNHHKVFDIVCKRKWELPGVSNKTIIENMEDLHHGNSR